MGCGASTSAAVAVFEPQSEATTGRAAEAATLLPGAVTTAPAASALTLKPDSAESADAADVPDSEGAPDVPDMPGMPAAAAAPAAKAEEAATPVPCVRHAPTVFFLLWRLSAVSCSFCAAAALT